MRSAQFHPFPQTHWSLIRRAGGIGAADDQERREALSRLLARYEPALRSYLRLVRRMPAGEADELLQAFITDRLLEHRLLERSDENRGRFRSLLLTSLNHFAASGRRWARRRAAVPLEDQEIADAGPSGVTPQAAVHAQWARALVHNVIHEMRRQCEVGGRLDVWRVFEGRILAEVFDEGPVVGYEALAIELKLKSPAQAANLLVTAKRMYARLLRAAVAEYESTEEGIEAELAELQKCLAGPAPRDADGTSPMAVSD